MDTKSRPGIRMLHNVLESAQLLADGMRSFNARCASGIEPNARRSRSSSTTRWC